MEIILDQLNYKFARKPLLIGGKAMEFYHLRKAGSDVDFVVSEEDYLLLAEMYAEYTKDLVGDLGIVKDGYELWKTICLFGYDYLSENAIDAGDYLVISLEKLLFLKCLAMKIPKYHQDVELIVARFMEMQYGPSD